MLQPHQLPDIEIGFFTPVYALAVLDHKKMRGPKELSRLIAADSFYKQRLTNEQRKIYKLHTEGDRHFLRARAKDA